MREGFETVLVRLLGPVGIAGDTGWVRAGPSKQACVLAALALTPGEAVPVGALIDHVWGIAPPDSANGTLYSYVARLRAALRPYPHVTVERAGAQGYRLDISAEDVDLHAMRGLAARARAAAAAGDDAAALEGWRRAALLSEGAPLSGVDGEWAAEVRSRLRAEWLEVTTARFAAELDAGQHLEVLDELDALARRHPDTEPLTRILLVALRRAGRDKDAAARFEEFAARAAADGREPSDELLALRDGDGEPAGDAVPAQLPSDTVTFLGRRAQVDMLRIRDGGVAAIDGMAGIGKTALAVHIAQQLAPEYPDGQLFLDLHGFSSSTAPVTPGEAIDRLLRALGVPAPAMPSNIDDKAALYRSTLAGRRMVVVLDNARDAEQVTPLLPGDGGKYVLITSRRRLGDLDDAHRVSLEALDREAAISLFAALAQLPDGYDTATVDRVVQLCGGLPLAIRVAAARLRSRPHWTPATLLAKLSDSGNLLSEFELGQRSVVAALRVSYAELDADHQLLFRTLGQARGADFGAAAVAALVGGSPSKVEDRLDGLVDAHLLMVSPSGRYRFHDLVGHFAREMAQGARPQAYDDAVRRLHEYYTRGAERAAHLLEPYFAGPRPHDDAPGDRDAALRWFETEHANLLTAVPRAVDLRHDAIAVRLAEAVCHYTARRAHFHDQIDVASAALRASERLGDDAARARMLNAVALALRKTDRHDEAERHLQAALKLGRALDDSTVTVMALNGLSNLHGDLGAYATAVRHMHEAVDLAQRADLPAHEARGLLNCVPRHVDLREYDVAARHLERSRELFALLGDTEELVRVDHHHARLLRAQGDTAAALPLLERAVEYCRRQRADLGLGYVLRELAVLRRGLGDLDGASQALEEALNLAVRSGLSTLQPSIHIELGNVATAAGDHETAGSHYRHGIELSAAHNHIHEQAVAHQAYARTLRALGKDDGADENFRISARLYHRAGLPLPEELASDEH